MIMGLFKKKLDIDAFIAGNVEGLRLATEAHQGMWRLGEEHGVKELTTAILAGFPDYSIKQLFSSSYL
jgi:hypothetical protein